MKKLFAISVLVLLILLSMTLVVSCAAPTPQPIPTPAPAPAPALVNRGPVWDAVERTLGSFEESNPVKDDLIKRGLVRLEG